MLFKNQKKYTVKKNVSFFQEFSPFFILLTGILIFAYLFLFPQDKAFPDVESNKPIILLISLYLFSVIYLIKRTFNKINNSSLSKKFKANQNLLNFINNTIKYAIVVINNDGYIQYWSNKAEEILEYSDEESINQHITKHIFPNTNAKKFITSKENKIPYDETAVTKNKTSISVAITSTPMKIYNTYWHILSIEDISQQAQTKQALIQTKEHLEIFIKKAPVAIAMLDNKMNYIAVSDYWYTDYNLKQHNIIGKNHYNIFPEIKKKKEWMDIHQRCLKGETIEKDEDKFIRSNGNVDWIKWKIEPWKEKDGTIGGLIMFTEPVTELKQQKIELEQHRDRLQHTIDQRTYEVEDKAAFINNNPAPVIHTDTKGTILTANPSANNLLLSNQHKKSLKDIFPDQIQYINKHIALRSEFQIEHYLDNKTYLFTFIYCREINSFYIYGTDISSKKQNEKELRMLKYSIDNSTVSVFWIKPDSTIFYVNNAACEILNYKKEELMKLKVTDIDAKITTEQWQAYYQNTKKNHSTSFESIQITKDGIKIPISVNSKYLFYENQEYIISFAIDIHERKQAEEELLLRTKQLKEFNQAMIGRELKVIELKKEINDLCLQQGKTAPYPAVWDE